MLLNALVPAVAHGGDPLIAAIAATDFCVSADGAEPAQVVDSAPAHHGFAQGNGACPFCQLSTGAPALPSRAQCFWFADPTSADPIVDPVAVAPTSRFWSSAQPRAPPPRLS
jgi:hypothetical protein